VVCAKDMPVHERVKGGGLGDTVGLGCGVC
jgi:hypothetical protein